MSVTSVVTETKFNATSNGNSKAKTKTELNGSTAPAKLTPGQAIDIAFQYGQSLAGVDGSLVTALVTFKDDKAVQADMLKALNIGYIMRKLNKTKDEAEVIYSLAKYNPKADKQTDKNRTLEQERVMTAVRVLWHRAKAIAFPDTAKTEAAIKAEQTRNDNEKAAKERQAKLEALAEIVQPKPETDVYEAMNRLVSTMKAYHSKHADKFVGDAGMAWRDWLAAAPNSNAKSKAPKSKSTASK